MNSTDIVLIIIMLIINTTFLYIVIKRKNKLSRSTYNIVSLGNGNDRIIDKLIIPLLFFNYIVILSYIIINEFSLIFLIIYISTIFLNLPIIYVSSDYIGTLIKGKNTENINFIEINIHSGDLEIILKYKNDDTQKLKYIMSIWAKNKDEKIEKFVNELKAYGYKVYVTGWKSI